jgi:hypothetical protein
MALDLADIRPADGTSANIAAAIERCTAAREAASAGLMQTKADRRTLLLSGTDAQLVANERGVARAENDIERLGLLAEELESALIAAKAAEARAEWAARVDAYNASQAAFAARWRAEYPEAADAIRSLLLAERECVQMLADIVELRNTGKMPAFPDGAPELADDRFKLFGDGNRVMGMLMQLPTADGKLHEDAPWYPLRPPLRS